MISAVIQPPRNRARRRGWCAAAVGFVLVALAGCGANPEPGQSASPDTSAATPGTSAAPAQAPAASEPRLTVVVSDPPIADLVAKVAGPAVEVVSVVPMGADGHTYEPVPSDARTLAEADVYIENGMGLNDVVSAFAVANYPRGTPHHVLSDVIPRAEIIATDTAEQIAAHGHAHSFNAHFWPDPNYALLYVERIAEILAEVDASDAAGYQQRATALVALLRQMDTAFRSAVQTIPTENRKLVVYHDSWSYFGLRYGLQVLGAIQPTDFSEPSAAELRATIEEVREAGVPAFFGSEVFPSDVLEVIEAESGARYVADLSDDRLPGSPGSPEHSYVGMMIANVRTIVTELGGDPSVLDGLPLAAA